MENWLVPCSVKFYDVEKHLDENEYIVCRRIHALKEGDNAYLYVGAPHSQIMFKCTVVNEDVSEDEMAKNQYAIKNGDASIKRKYVKLKRIHKYTNDELTLSKLREYGLGQTQTQARVDRHLLRLINRVDNDLGV